MLGAARAWLYLVVLTFRRQLLSKKTILVVLFILLSVALVIVVGVVDPWTPRTFGEWILYRVFLTFVVPVLSMAYGTGALGDDRDEKTLLYLRVRPVPRSGMYLAKILAVVPLACTFSLGALLVLCILGNVLSNEGMEGLFGAFWPAILGATLAYLSLFHLFAAAFRHSTAVALGYIFFMEVFIAQMPGILKRISVRFYAQSMTYESAKLLGLGPTGHELRFYLPVDGSTARTILAGMTLGCLLAGSVLFAIREYRDVG